MGLAHRAILAGVLGFAASVVVACGGGSGLLSGDQANSLKGQLDQVSTALASGACNNVSGAIGSFSNAVANLPSSVNATLRNNLSQGASTVAQLARQECRPAAAKPRTETTPATTTETTPATTTETTPATTTTTTPTTPTTPTNTTPTHTTTTPATPTTPSGTTPTGTSGGAGLTGGTTPSGGSGTGNGNGNGGNGQ
jgi:hypothetical protein